MPVLPDHETDRPEGIDNFAFGSYRSDRPGEGADVNRRWWDAAVLAIVAVAVVVGLAHGSVGAVKPDPAPTVCVPQEFNGGVCVHGQLVWPTDGRGDLPGQSPDPCTPGSLSAVLCDRNGKLATTDGPPPSTPPAPRPRPPSTPSRAKPTTSMLPSYVCAHHPENFFSGVPAEDFKKFGFC